MDKAELVAKKIQNYAVENGTSQFDKILPENPIKASISPRRIPYVTNAGTAQIITLDKSNKYHQSILKAYYFGFQSDWFLTLSNGSKLGYLDKARILFDWINQSGHKSTSKTRYNVLKAFEKYEMNDRGKKKSPLIFINKVLHEGMVSTSLADTDYVYLQSLLSLSKPIKNPVPVPCTLSSWFDLPWMRSVIGEHAYLQLESPRLLFKSFRVTIATTLLYLMKQRKRWHQSRLIKFEIKKKYWQYAWNRMVLMSEGKFDEQGEPEDEFSELLLLDLITPRSLDVVKKRLAKSGSRNLPKTFSKNKMVPWQRPVFFHPDSQTTYSALEEVLCGWLAACEGIQPSDIPKLKVNNYACERTRSGRLIAMECTYYKGRSGKTQQPAILMANDSWTKAIDQYIRGLSNSSLFKTRIAAQMNLTLFHRHSSINLMFKIWKTPNFRKTLDSELKRHEASHLFLNAMFALESSDEGFSQFYDRTGKKVKEYQMTASRPLPRNIFTFTHIKNTSVHSDTDSYRESDLINHHSHSSLVEKTSYLNDSNKEWVNQAGRITRLILHDLQNVVFKPSITEISESVNDRVLRTQIADATHTRDITTHSLRSFPSEGDNSRDIIVLDIEDTALYFFHYISQAESHLTKLLEVRPDWVEKTLIVQVEWMNRTLTRMSAAAGAKKLYSKLAAHLPPLFDHLLETIE